MQLILFRANTFRSGVKVVPTQPPTATISNHSKQRLFNNTQLEKLSYIDMKDFENHPLYILVVGKHKTITANAFFGKKRLIESIKSVLFHRLDSIDVWKGYFTSGREVLRTTFVEGLNGAMSPTGSNLTSTLLLGKTSAALVYNSHVYKTTGTLHLFVISGFHLGYIATFVSQQFLGVFKKNTVLLLTVAVLWLYFYLVGFSPGLFRAFLMFMISTMILFFKRQKRGLAVLFLTILMVLFIDISILSSISFQLSFSAVVGIYLWKSDYTSIHQNKHIKKLKKSGYIGKIIYEFCSSILFSCAVLSVLLPLLAYYFSEVSIVGILATALVGWTIPVILKHTLYVAPLLFIETVFFENLKVLTFLLVPIDVLIQLMTLLLKNLDFAWSTVVIAPFSPMYLVAYYMLYILIYSAKNYIFAVKKRRWYEKNYTFF